MRRSLWTLYASQVVMIAGIALSFPFFALYLNKERGLPMGTVGILLCASLLLSGLSHGLGGELSDRLGRRAVMLGAMWSRTALIALLGAAVQGEWPLGAVVAIHFAASFVGNFFPPAARSWIADHCVPTRRVEAYGWLRVAGNLGWAIGPALGGFLAERSYARMFFATSVFCSVCAVLLGLGLRDKEGFQRSEGFSASGLFSSARDPKFLRFGLCALLLTAVMAQMVVPLSVHAVTYAGLSESQVGLLFSLNGSVVVATQFLGARLLKNTPQSRVLAWGSLLYAFSYATVGFLRGFPALAGAMVAISLAEVAVSPALQTLSANLAPQGLQGRFTGLSGMMEHVGMAAGPLLGGFFQQHLSPTWPAAPWLLIGGVGVLASSGFLALGPRLSAREQGLED